MSEYPATSLALNKGKHYVLLTIPPELREHFNGRKQFKRSTGTRDLQDAKRRLHKLSAELYTQLDACKPDIRDVISDLLGWIGDAEEAQRLEDEGQLEETIIYHKNVEHGENPENNFLWTSLTRMALRHLRCTVGGRPRKLRGRLPLARFFYLSQLIHTAL